MERFQQLLGCGEQFEEASANPVSVVKKFQVWISCQWQRSEGLTQKLPWPPSWSSYVLTFNKLKGRKQGGLWLRLLPYSDGTNLQSFMLLCFEHAHVYPPWVGHFWITLSTAAVHSEHVCIDLVGKCHVAEWVGTSAAASIQFQSP